MENIGLVVLGVILLVVVCLVGWFIKTGNGFTKKRIGVEQAFSNIDVWLTNRYNVLTNMVDTVRDYTSYEAKTLETIVGLRQGRFQYEAGNVQGVQAAEDAMRQVERDILLQLESYPKLGASEVFRGLQQSVWDCEDNLQAAHRGYNASVTSYNTAIALFPASIVAGMKGLKPYAMFEAQAQKRADVSVKL